MAIGHDIARRLEKTASNIRDCVHKTIQKMDGRKPLLSHAGDVIKEATAIKLFADAFDRLLEVKNTQDELIKAQRERITQLEVLNQQLELKLHDVEHMLLVHEANNKLPLTTSKKKRGV